MATSFPPRLWPRMGSRRTSACSWAAVTRRRGTLRSTCAPLGAAAARPGLLPRSSRDRRPGTGCRRAGATSTRSGHVNHPVVLTYLEEGRDAFLKRHGIPREEYVVGRCSVSFRDEIDPALEAVTVQCEVRELGRSSVTTSERICPPHRTGAWSRRSSAWCCGIPRSAARDRSPMRSGLPCGLGGGESLVSGWNSNPVVVTVAVDRGRRVSGEQPQHPVHDRGDRRTRASRRAGPAPPRCHLHVREDDGNAQRMPRALPGRDPTNPLGLVTC